MGAWCHPLWAFPCKATITKLFNNTPFPSSSGPQYQNELKCSAFDMERVFNSHANKTHFHKKSCALGLILKVRVFGTRKWSIQNLYPLSFE